MLPPSARLPIFQAAFRAHGIFPHGNVLPVIGNGFQDAVTGPTGRAADEGIPKTPVFGISQLRQTVCADGKVGRNQREIRSVFRLALHDQKILRLRTCLSFLFHNHPVHPGGWRRTRTKAMDQLLHRLFRSICFDSHHAAAVAHASPNGKRSGALRHKGAEAHALHHAEDGDLRPHTSVFPAGACAFVTAPDPSAFAAASPCGFAAGAAGFAAGAGILVFRKESSVFSAPGRV